MPETSPFRAVWVTLGKLRERLETEASPETIELGRQLTLEIGEAEEICQAKNVSEEK